MDKICKDIIKALGEEDEIYVRDFQKKTGYPSKTINAHLKHIDGEKISFQFKDRKKYYFLLPKQQLSAQKIDEQTVENIAKIRGLMKKTLSLYQNTHGEYYLGLVLKVGKLLLLELGKIYVYKSGLEEKDYLKRWIDEENDLTEILESLASPKNLEFRKLLEAYIGFDTVNLIKEIEAEIKEIEDKSQSKKELEEK